MSVIVKFVAWFLGLGSTVIVPIILIILGLAFRIGWQKAVRGGITVGVGLAGLFLIVDLIVAALQPAIQAMAARFHLALTLVDVDWADAGIAWGWPGVAGVIVGIIVINAIMVVLRITKTMWTDVWSYWHGSALAGFVWALTGGNVLLGIIAGVVYLAIGSILADYTAKDLQEFNEMPGISVPCGPAVQIAWLAKYLVKVLDAIPGVKDLDASPEAIRKRFGIFGELGVMGAVLGLVIGLVAGYNLSGMLQLAMKVATMMVILPRMVSILSEGLVPITQSVIQFMRERFKGREVYVSVDCAVLLGHPSVMAASVLLFPLSVLLAALLPGNKLLPIASLAEVPFLCGAVAPYTKGNVLKTVIIVLIWTIPILYLASLTAGPHTHAYQLMGQYTEQIKAGSLLASTDMGGDPIGFVIQTIVRLLGLARI